METCFVFYSFKVLRVAFREHWSHHRTSLVWPTRSKSICNMRMHMHIHALTDTLSQSARVRWPDCSPPLRAIIGQKARGMTGTGHLIMSASAVFVTQTASQCYWGPGRNMQRKPCNLPLMPWQKKHPARWTRVLCRFALHVKVYVFLKLFYSFCFFVFFFLNKTNHISVL